MKELLLDKGLSFERLKSLLQVSRLGGLSKAAPGDVSRQNLIGRQIRDLESFFQTRLTIKQGKVLSLNDNGQRLACKASHILQLIEDFKRESLGKRKVFRLSAGGSLYSELAASRLAKLKRFSLEIHLRELWHEKIFDALVDSEIDAALVWGDYPPSMKFSEITVGSFKYSLFFEKHLLRGRRTEEALFNLPFVVVLHRDFSAEIRHRVKSDEIIVVDENMPALRLVQSGGYAAILPSLFRVHLPASRFAAVEPEFLKAYARKVRFIWNPRAAEVRGFSSSAMENIAKHFML